MTDEPARHDGRNATRGDGRAEGRDATSGGGGGGQESGRHEAPRSWGSRLLGWLREVAIVVSLALVLSVLAKTFLVQSFWIPSDSMNDTLIKDDRVMVSKLTPGPFDLARGDVVVFEDPGHWLRGLPPAAPRGDGLGDRIKRGLTWAGVLPSDEDNHLIKRVIGLPGDHVRCCGASGKLEINGHEVTETYLFPGDSASAMPFDIVVPAGRVWVMGDHRSDSADSRYNDTNPEAGGTGTDPKDHTGYFGSVPIDKVVGRAMAIVLPLGRVRGLGGEEVFAGVPAPAAPPSAGPSGSGGASATGTRTAGTGSP